MNEIDRLNANPHITVLTAGTIVIDGPEEEGNLEVEAVYDPKDRWNGFIAAPYVAREQVEKIATWVNTEGSEQRLRFDGNVLVLKTLNDDRECDGHESTSGAIGSVKFCDGTCKPKWVVEERIEPTLNGKYNVGFGWVWVEKEPLD
jgi:hypothetical protein